jgi:hypothetical protein
LWLPPAISEYPKISPRAKIPRPEVSVTTSLLEVYDTRFTTLPEVSDTAGLSLIQEALYLLE